MHFYSEPSGFGFKEQSIKWVIDCVLWKFANDLPVFVQIKDIILLESSQTKFVVQPLETVAFSNHFHSYEVAYQHSVPDTVCIHSDFIDHSVLCAYQQYHSTSHIYIPVKYQVLSDFD